MLFFSIQVLQEAEGGKKKRGPSTRGDRDPEYQERQTKVGV